MSTLTLKLGVGAGTLLAVGAVSAPLMGSASAVTPVKAARATPYASGPKSAQSIVAAHRAAGARSSGQVAHVAAPHVATAGPVANGGFETGDFTGYGTDQTFAGQTQGGGDHLYVYSGGTSNSLYDVPTPVEGADAAILDDGSGNGSEVLYQDIAVPAGGGTLSFAYSYDSFAPIASPDSLDYTTNRVTAANQQFRADIVTTSAPLRSVAAGDVLAGIVRTQTGDPTATGTAAQGDPYQASTYTSASVNLTPYAGSTVRLRFATADNQDSLLAEVDNITFTPTLAAALPEAPEAALIPVAFLAVIGAAGYRKHRRA